MSGFRLYEGNSATLSISWKADFSVGGQMYVDVQDVEVDRENGKRETRQVSDKTRQDVAG